MFEDRCFNVFPIHVGPVVQAPAGLSLFGEYGQDFLHCIREEDVERARKLFPEAQVSWLPPVTR